MPLFQHRIKTDSCNGEEHQQHRLLQLETLRTITVSILFQEKGSKAERNQNLFGSGYLGPTEENHSHKTQKHLAGTGSMAESSEKNQLENTLRKNVAILKKGAKALVRNCQKYAKPSAKRVSSTLQGKEHQMIQNQRAAGNPLKSKAKSGGENQKTSQGYLECVSHYLGQSAARQRATLDECFSSSTGRRFYCKHLRI